MGFVKVFFIILTRVTDDGSKNYLNSILDVLLQGDRHRGESGYAQDLK